MKTAALLLAALVAAWPQTAQVALNKGTVPQVLQLKIAPQTFRDLEKRFDGRLESLVPDPDDPVELLGNTRGLYVEGCGVVFTAEVSLVKILELNPFRREIPKELADRIHNRRVERLPVLERAMDEMLHAMAMTFVQIPPSQRVVLAVRLLYSSWENTSGMPSQVMMTATRAGVQTRDIKVEIQ
ncbi:MAG TPA: hypothetical protein VMH28_34985 [Candidatus Acidoferrales bacterium]|nr:hypothetical protein [Bryobacteraceae bacterium]HTS67297.1 hypothetical protein [Candidatus Acidoferrales bacterium]